MNPRERRDVHPSGFARRLVTPPTHEMHLMATRVMSRRAMREQHDQADENDQETETVESDSASEPEVVTKKPRARKVAAKPAGPKPAAKPRARKKTVKVPPRMVARWAVCDGALKRIAVFEYRDRIGADAKLAEMRERKTGTFVLQLVKDPYDPPVVAV